MTPRLARLQTLLGRMDRPGGMYPPLWLASRPLSEEECVQRDELLATTTLAPVLRVWNHPAERVFALTHLDPAFAHVHLLIADLHLRDDDVRAEPFPEILRSLRELRPELWASYGNLHERFMREADSESEINAHKNGFGYCASEAESLLASAAERECFARGCLVLGNVANPTAASPGFRAELLEFRLQHSAAGASAGLDTAEFAALECPELLTSLSLRYYGTSGALTSLARAPNLRTLGLASDQLTVSAAEAGVLSKLSLETLVIDAPANAPFPDWTTELPTLRVLLLRYSSAKENSTAVELPANLGTLTQLESLELNEIRSAPVDLGRLRNLRDLKIRGWALAGIPASLTELTQLEKLSVDPVTALPGVPDGFEQLRALRSVRLGHLVTPELPRVLLRMPWLQRVELISDRRWPKEQEAELRRALPHAYVSVSFTGRVLRGEAPREEPKPPPVHVVPKPVAREESALTAMTLVFDLPEPRSVARFRALFEAMASTLTGRPVSLQQRERKEEPDPNPRQQNACFVARWSDGDVTWIESVRSDGGGDPRDGYGYALEFSLTLPTLTLRAADSSSEPLPRGLRLYFAATGREWLALRKTLQTELGVENDRSQHPAIVAPVLTALAREGEEAAALTLAKECLASASQADSGREEVITWLATHDRSAGGASMQVKEAPAMLEGWLKLERAGDSTLGPIFARLCPYDLARWKAAALQPGPWFAHPAWPLERAPSSLQGWRTIHLAAGYVSEALAPQLSEVLTGWKRADWHDVEGERLNGDDGWHWTISRRARYPEGSKRPVVHVELEGVRREPQEWALSWDKLSSMPLREELRWSWLGGPETGDALVLIERSLPLEGPTPTRAAIAFTVVGSHEFRARSEEAMTRVSRLRWYPVDASASLTPWQTPEPRFDDARAALKAALPPEGFARAEELLKCRCAQPKIGCCEHRVELLRCSREEEHSPSPSGRARSAAWSAAFAVTGDRPDRRAERTNLLQVHAQLLLAAEFIG